MIFLNGFATDFASLADVGPTKDDTPTLNGLKGFLRVLESERVGETEAAAAFFGGGTVGVIVRLRNLSAAVEEVERLRLLRCEDFDRERERVRVRGRFESEAFSLRLSRDTERDASRLLCRVSLRFTDTSLRRSRE